MSAGSTESILGIGKDNAPIKNPYGNQYKTGFSYKDKEREVYSSIGSGIVKVNGKDVNLSELGVRALSEGRASKVEGIDVGANFVNTIVDKPTEATLKEQKEKNNLDPVGNAKRTMGQFWQETKALAEQMIGYFETTPHIKAGVAAGCSADPEEDRQKEKELEEQEISTDDIKKCIADIGEEISKGDGATEEEIELFKKAFWEQDKKAMLKLIAMSLKRESVDKDGKPFKRSKIGEIFSEAILKTDQELGDKLSYGDLKREIRARDEKSRRLAGSLSHYLDVLGSHISWATEKLLRTDPSFKIASAVTGDVAGRAMGTTVEGMKIASDATLGEKATQTIAQVAADTGEWIGENTTEGQWVVGGILGAAAFNKLSNILKTVKHTHKSSKMESKPHNEAGSSSTSHHEAKHKLDEHAHTDVKSEKMFESDFTPDYQHFPVQTEWSAPVGTKQTYKVYQRDDINWDMVRTKGPEKFIGRTNREAALAGRMPQLSDSEFVAMHHIGQSSKGPLVEVTTDIHDKTKQAFKSLHNQFDGKAHPEFPVDRRKWDAERAHYWKWRAKNAKK